MCTVTDAVEKLPLDAIPAMPHAQARSLEPLASAERQHLLRGSFRRGSQDSDR